VNLTSRVEAIAKAINVPVIVTDSFAAAFDGPLISLGRHRLRGLSEPHELFAPSPPAHVAANPAPGHDAPASRPLTQTTE
jgi:class 3 adenylate cyclase